MVGVLVIQSTWQSEAQIPAGEADGMIAAYEADPAYVVRRVWDRVAFCVSVWHAGDGVPFVVWLVGHDDMTWRGE